jgi:hypothetical protein
VTKAESSGLGENLSTLVRTKPVENPKPPDLIIQRVEVGKRRIERNTDKNKRQTT